jgi:predicted porin
LFALATLAATTAFAQSSVQVVGTFDPSLVSQQTTYGDGKAVTQQFVRNNTQGTSQITFKGTEDLGGGLKVNFLLENDFDAGKNATGNISSLGGEQFLNLEGGFGKVFLGAPNTPSLFTQSSSQPFGTKIGGGFGAANTGRVRFDNTVQYNTPNISGFVGMVSYSTQTKTAVNSYTGAAPSWTQVTDGSKALQNTVSVGAVTDIGVIYNNGPLSAGVSMFKIDPTGLPTATATAAGAASKNEQTNAYARYDFGFATLGLGVFTEKQTNTGAATGTAAVPTYTITSLDTQSTNVGAWVPLSPALTLLGSYTKKDDKTSLNLDRTVAAIGLKYTFSKMTSVYARYVDDKISNVDATRAAFAKQVNTTAIGMMTNF